jgi:TonB family protein
MLNWTASAWPILASAALKSTLVLGAAWLIVYLMRGRSAAARHMVWTASAAALLALPFLSVGLPALRVRMANAVLPADPGIVFRATADTAADAGGMVAGKVSPAGRTGSTPAPERGMNSRDALLLLWVAGIAAGFLQMLAALAMLWRTRRAARVSPDQGEADTLAFHLGIDHPVQVLETSSGMPMTFGVLRPTVLLPEEARAWSGERRRVVLLHELAHVLRGDAVTHLLARTALVLHWWNPLAWTMWREFLKERERATDDLVLGTGATASDYAGHLLEIARTMQARTASAAAGVAMARRSQLEGRLLAILDGRRQRGQQGLAATMVAAVLAIAIMAPLAAVRAQSQAEQNAPPEVAATILAANAQKNHEILDKAAVTYEQLRKFAEAQKLREASLTLTEQVSGQLSKDYAVALVKLGDLARKRGAWQESTAYYLKALEQGDRPEAFPALMSLGRDAFRGTMNLSGGLQAAVDGAGAAFRGAVGIEASAPGQRVTLNSDPAKALEFFKRARNVANNGNDMGSALTWMAQVRQSEPDGAPEAESLYRAAMAAEDSDSAEQALTQEFYAGFLKAQDRALESGVAAARAKGIRKSRVAAMGPQEAAVSPVFRVGGGVTAPKLLYKVEPQYSEEARSAKYQGTVLLKVVVDVDGLAKDIQVVNGLGLGLDEQAVTAIMQWKFKPGEQDGVPVPVMAQIEINFKLK